VILGDVEQQRMGPEIANRLELEEESSATKSISVDRLDERGAEIAADKVRLPQALNISPSASSSSIAVGPGDGHQRRWDRQSDLDLADTVACLLGGPPPGG
jgi:hypothetical protein